MILDILCVTYNQNESLKCFINSIKSQTNPNWRLIIVHDGPNPNLKLDLLNNNYLTNNVLFIEYPHRTQNYGHHLRAWGLKNFVENDYILITNGDNYYTPNMVNEVLNKNEDFIFFDCIHSHKRKKNHNKQDYGLMVSELKESMIDMGCVVVKSNLAKQIGFNHVNYSADWKYFEDVLATNPTISKINKVLFVHN
jgi:glycosyltransferase involved in cell wall biosynthesis